MTSWQASNGDRPTGADGAFRALGLAAVCLGVAALAAATFVLSYQSIRAVALQAGIEPRYARGYPLLIDAMLVIALASVLALRGAGVPSRMLSWLTLLVVLGAAAGADTLHANGRTLPHNAAVITAAVLPWALVFVAFVLLVAILRNGRLRRQLRIALAQPAWTQPVGDGQAHSQQSPAAPALPVRSPEPYSVSIVPGFTSQLASAAAAGAAAGAAAADGEPWAQGGAPDDDAEVQAANRDQEAAVVDAAHPAGPAAAEDADSQIDEAETQTDEAPEHTEDDSRSDEADAPTQEGDDMPVFHRISSSPTAPEA